MSLRSPGALFYFPVFRLLPFAFCFRLPPGICPLTSVLCFALMRSQPTRLPLPRGAPSMSRLPSSLHSVYVAHPSRSIDSLAARLSSATFRFSEFSKPDNS